MSLNACKRKARQRSAEDLDDSFSTGFQILDTDKNDLTEKQIQDITQQIESKMARKVKNKMRRTEIAILKTIGSRSELNSWR